MLIARKMELVGMGVEAGRGRGTGGHLVVSRRAHTWMEFCEARGLELVTDGGKGLMKETQALH